MADAHTLLFERDMSPQAIASSGYFSRREKLERLNHLKQELARRTQDSDMSLDNMEDHAADIEIAIRKVKRQSTEGHDGVTLGRMPSA